MNTHTNSDNDTAQIILLHGAGLGKWIWDGVTPNLNISHKALNLPGREGEADMGSIRLQDAIDYVAQYATVPTVIVGHSFSASVALGVAAQYPASVAGVVLVGGVVSGSGKSFLSNLPLPIRLLLGTYIRFSRNGVKLPDSLIENEYCNDLSDEAKKKVLANITPEVPRYYLDKLDWAIPAGMPCSYVKLLNDKSLSLEQQDQFAARLPGNSIDTLPTGHLPMVAQPQQMATLLNERCAQIIDAHSVTA